MNQSVIKKEPGIAQMSMDKIAALACAILIYVMGRFQLTDLLEIKRIVQFILFTPILGYFLIKLPEINPRKHFNPLIGVVLLMLCINLYFHMNILWLFDYIFSLVGLYVLLTVSRANIVAGVELIVGIATFFSCLALIQFVILVIFPDLVVHTRLAFLEDGSLTTISPNEGVSVVSNLHPIALLGLMTDERLNVFGLEISRMRSFTSEPSLLLVYFLFPAVLGLFLNKPFWTKCSLFILFFSLLSFSSSVQICLVFALVYFFASFFFPNRFIFISFPFIILGITLGIMLTIGLDVFTAFDANLASSESTDFLAKGNSLVVRGNGIIEAVNEAIHSPFGSGYNRSLPLSIILSSMISAGWTGMILLLIFFYKLISRLDLKLKSTHSKKNILLGAAIFFGLICTIFLFNDYAMLNYTGIIFLVFTYRLLGTDFQSTVNKIVSPN